MRQLVIRNKPFLWKPIRSKELSILKHRPGYPYMSEHGIALVADASQPIYRYAKNFEKSKVGYSICLFTNEQDEEKVQKFFDDVHKSLKKADVTSALSIASSGSVKYLDTFYKENK